jgi:large conductance mechanosensitive channel
MSGFKKFLLRGNLVDLAVAFVLGVAFAGLITALVADFITPLLGLIGGKGAFGDRSFTVRHSVFKYGEFVNALIAFIIVVAVLYFLVVVPFSALLARFKKEPDLETPTRECPECLSAIPVAARRCAFCTATLEAPAAVVAQSGPGLEQ